MKTIKKEVFAKKDMVADTSIGKYIHYVDGTDVHLQKIAEKFSSIGNYWVPRFLIDGELTSLPPTGTYRGVNLYIYIGQYGSQRGYNIEEGFVTHTKSFNAQNVLIPVGVIDVRSFQSYYVDDEGWNQTSHNVTVSNWARKNPRNH